MLKWSGCKKPKRILDVGCGFGGTSRLLADKFQDSQVEGITLSAAQVKRGGELAEERYESLLLLLSAGRCNALRLV
jgi:MPBQ/MSBQ methyltransferase